MAKLKNIKKDLNLDLNKKVVICAKGASSSMVVGNNYESCYTAAINTASSFFDKVDFLFINDIENVKNHFDEGIDFNKIKNIIVPIQIHFTGRALGPTYIDVLDMLREFDHINLYTYKLHTQNIKTPLHSGQAPDEIRFGELISTYNTAVYWLVEAGFRDFEVYGVSKDGIYNEKFYEKNKNPRGNRSNSWFEWNYGISEKHMILNQCKYKIY